MANSKNIKCVDLSKEDFDVVIAKFEEKRKIYKKINPCLVIQLLSQNNVKDVLNNIIFPELNKVEHQNLKWMFISDNDDECDTNDIFNVKNLPISKWKSYVVKKTSSIDIVILKTFAYDEWNVSRACMLFKI